MSGAICPDCSEAWFETSSGPTRCRICGWRGDLDSLGRKILAYDDEPRVGAMELKQAGRLFFVRVDFAGAPPEQASFEVLHALGARSASDRNGGVLVRMDHRPTDAQVAAVRALPGVASVEVV